MRRGQVGNTRENPARRAHQGNGLVWRGTQGVCGTWSQVKEEMHALGQRYRGPNEESGVCPKSGVDG